MNLADRINLIKEKTSLSKENIFLLLVSFVALIFSAALERPAMHEGSWWFYIILDTKSFFFDSDLYRHADALFQVPAVISAHLFPDNFTVTYSILNYSYALIPALFLILNIYLCCVYNLKQIIPLLTTAWYLGFLAAAGLSVNCTSSSLSYFWTLLILILKPDQRSRLENFFILFLYLLLAFSYDLTLVVLPVLFAAHLGKILKKESRFLSLEGVFLAVCACCFVWYLVRFHYVFQNLNGRDREFKTIFFSTDDPNVVQLAILLIVFCIIQIFYVLNLKYKKIASSFAFIALSLGFAYCLWRTDFFSWVNLGNARNHRFFSMPVTAFFAFWALIYVFKKVQISQFIELQNNLILIFAACLCISFDISFSLLWKNQYEYFQKLPTKPGCNYVPLSWFETTVPLSTLREYNSILAQKKYSIDRITYFKTDLLNECRTLNDRGISVFTNRSKYIMTGSRFLSTRSHFDYTSFIRAAEKK